MMLGSFRLTGPGLLAGPPAGHPPPEDERRVNFSPGGEATVGEDVVRTGPWMGQEGEGMWTGWWGEGWEGSSPSAVRAPGWWYWPGVEAGKLKRGMGTWAWPGLVGPAGPLLREAWGELEHWDRAWGATVGWGE